MAKETDGDRKRKRKEGAGKVLYLTERRPRMEDWNWKAYTIYSSNRET